MAIECYLAKWHLDDPWMTFDPSLCDQCITLEPTVLLAKFGGHRVLFGQMTPAWPLDDLWPQPVWSMYNNLSQRFFWSSLVVIECYLVKWPLDDPWMTFDPNLRKQFITLEQQFFWPSLVATECYLAKFDYFPPNAPYVTFDPNLSITCMKLGLVVLLTKFGDHSMFFEGEVVF